MSLEPGSIEQSDDVGVAAKPPFLRRVQIRGYKSIEFCDVMLEPLTVFVGRNASGKSNFLDALGFLADLFDSNVAEAVKSRFGLQSIFTRGSPTQRIHFDIEGTFASLGKNYRFDFSILVAVGKHHQAEISSEELEFTEVGSEEVHGFKRSGNKLDWFGNKADRTLVEPVLKHDIWSDFVAHDHSVLSMIGRQPYLDLALSFRESDVFSFDPRTMRLPMPRGGYWSLLRDGSNLAQAIETLGEIEPRSLDRINRQLTAIVPDIISFAPGGEDDSRTVIFSLRHRLAEQPVDFRSWSMSDGTLRALASLVAIHQIFLPNGFPGFVGIEEPETSLHPAAADVLVEAFEEATLRTQILLSTHSVEFLNHSAIQPKNVRIVQTRNGRTEITPIDAASDEIVAEHLETLGDLERQDRLEINVDDLERQGRLARNGVAHP